MNNMVSWKVGPSQLIYCYIMITYVMLLRMEISDTIYTDFRKAFDSVNHALLIKKLQAMGIDGALLCWLSSFSSLIDIK